MNKWMKRRIERSRARCRRADVVKREESKVDPKGEDCNPQITQISQIKLRRGLVN
jgi:hypothetical protein